MNSRNEYGYLIASNKEPTTSQPTLTIVKIQLSMQTRDVADIGRQGSNTEKEQSVKEADRQTERENPPCITIEDSMSISARRSSQ